MNHNQDKSNASNQAKVDSDFMNQPRQLIGHLNSIGLPLERMSKQTMHVMESWVVCEQGGPTDRDNQY